MEKTQLLREIDAFVEENEKSILRDMRELVSKRSVKEPAEPGAPYGPGPRNALDTALGIARRLGLSACDGDGYVGWGEIPGEKTHKEQIAIIAHVDVVPEGEEGWNSDPYVLTEKEGWLIGRGISDDKGAAVISLYAAAFLARAGRPLNYGVRVLLGCDEESGMHDVPYYLERNPEPIFCFTPDVDFPVSIGEKGVYAAGGFLSEPVFTTISSFSGGFASNAIPGKASCVVHAPGKNFKDMKGITVSSQKDGSFLIEAQGIGGHAAEPEGKINAIGMITDFLLDNEIGSAGERLFLELLRKIHSNAYGEGIGIACTGKKLGRLTCIGGMIAQKDGVVRQDVNIRYPECVTGEEITQTLTKTAAANHAQFEAGEIMTKAFYISPDSPAIKALLSAYRDITGRPAEAYTMSGGTYAQFFKNGVGFGPGETSVPRPSFVASDHAPNEASYLPSLKAALKIFILALWQLQELSPEELGQH